MHNFDFKKIISLALLFLCFWLPLNHAQQNLQQTEDAETQLQQTKNKQSLINEMRAFQKELKPEYYLKRILKKIEIDFLKSTEASQEFCAGPRFVAFLKSKLWSEFKIKPLFIISSEENLEKSHAFLSSAMHLTNTSSKEFKDLLVGMTAWELWSDRTENFSRPIMNFMTRFKAKIALSSYANAGSYFVPELKKYLGSYFFKLPDPEKILKLFSDIQNFSFIYLYPEIFIKNGEFKGFYLLAIRETDIDLASFFNFATSSTHITKTGIARNIVSVDKIKSGFYNEPGYEVFYDGIPYELKSLIYSFRRQNRSNQQDLSATKILKVKRPKQEQNSSWLLKTILSLKKVTVSCFILIVIRCALFGFNLALNLRKKFMLIIAVFLVGPLTLLAFNAALISRKLPVVELSLAQSRLENALNRFENLINESRFRLFTHNLGIKDFMIRNSFGRNVKNFPAHSLNQIMAFNCREMLMLDSKGISICHTRIRGFSQPETVELNYAFKFLNALGSLDLSCPDAFQGLQKAQLSDGFIGDLAGVIHENQVMANEGLITVRLTRPSSLALGQYFLVPDPRKQVIKPGAIVFTGFKIQENFLELLKNSPRFLLDNLYQAYDGTSLSLAIAAKTSTSLHKIYYAGDSHYEPDFEVLFSEAASTEPFGTSLSQADGKAILKSWRSYENTPIMLAGQSIIELNKSVETFWQILPTGALVFSFLMLILLAEIGGKLFLPPVTALKKAIERVDQHGDFSVKVEVHNNDEFDQMGQAFNKMTQGLLQRKHLARFVSDRLLQRFEANNDSPESVAEEIEVTILSSDIRNFTSLTEELEPEKVVTILNRYFTEMEKAIVRHDGVIDKFIGDAIIAVFYKSSKSHNICVNACNAALEMRKALARMNDTNQFGIELENGIGLATGTVISGGVGMPGKRLEYSVTGQVIKTAEYLESLTKETGLSRILADEKTKALTDSKFCWQPWKNAYMLQGNEDV